MSVPTTPLGPPTRKLEPRKLMTVVALALGGAGFGIGAGSLVGRMLKHSLAASERAHSPLALLWLPVCLFVVVLVHELGHVIGGRLAGMRFVLLVAGPLKLMNPGGRLRLRLNTQLALAGGIALMLPRTPDRFREQMLWVVAGGPLASVVLAVAGFASMPFLHGTPMLVALLLGFLSAMIAVATLIPSSAGGYASDGAQLLGLRRHDPNAEMRALLALVAGASMSGTRPRDYDAGLLARAAALEGPPLARMAVHVLRGMQALDRGEPSGPHFEAIAPLFHEAPTGLRQGLALWLAWYHAVERDDAALAQRWLEAGKGGLVDDDQRDLAVAAVAYARGEREAAGSAIERGLSRRGGLDPGASHLVQDLLRQLRQRLAS